MRAAILIAACLSCGGQARKENKDDLTPLLFAMHPAARVNSGTGIRARASARPSFADTQSRFVAARMVGGPDSEVSIAAASAGAALGVFFEQDLITVGLLALAAAYATTLGNEVGDAAKSVGGVAAKAYKKAKHLNEQYDILPQTKGAADKFVTRLDNFIRNYGVTDQIDQKPPLKEKMESAKGKLEDLTSLVTSKVDELKDSAKKPARPSVRRYFAATQSRVAVARMVLEEPDSEVSIGAAGAGAALGVFFEQDLVTVGLLALAAAYAATLDNEVGDAAKSVGGVAAKAYIKARNLNEQYDILPKAKGAVDKVVTLFGNLDRNYGITDKIDQKLLLGEKIERVKDKLEDLTSSVTSKVDELKESAKKPP